MPNIDRRSILAVAVLLAACDGAAPGNPTGSASTAAPSPAPTTAAVTPSSTTIVSPTILPRPTLFEGCIDLDDADLGDIDVDLAFVEPNGSGGTGLNVGRVAADLQVTRIEERSGRRRSVAPAPRALDNEKGLLLGGVEFVTAPFTWFDGHVTPQAMLAATVTLALAGGEPIKLPTRIVPGNENFDQIAVAVPDIAGTGTIAFDLAWADACYRYEASASLPVDVVPRTVSSGCVLEWDAYYHEVNDLLDDAIRVGGTTVRSGSPVNEAKFGPWSNPGIDASILYSFDEEAPAIAVAPGAALRVERTTTDLTLRPDMSLWVWTRASVARAVKDYPPYGAQLVLSRTPSMQSDGSFRLRAPVEPGRYVAGVELTFDSQCSSGTLWSAVNIDVVAP